MYLTVVYSEEAIETFESIAQQQLQMGKKKRLMNSENELIRSLKL